MDDKTLQKKDRATLSTLPTILGCSPLFDSTYEDALMSLSLQGSSPFLDWLGWTKTNICTIKRGFITYVRASATEGGTKSAGYLADPCADPNGVEFGSADFTLTDFGRLRRAGPTRDITKSQIQASINQPRFRLDGSAITDQREFDIRLATEALMQDLKELVISGNAGTGGQFDGLQQLVATGYTDSNGVSIPLMDSIVIDWNGNGLSGGSGITWNSLAVGSTYGLVDVLTSVYRRIRQRIRMAPALNAQKMNVGDIIIVMPEDFIPVLLDSFTCWSVCPDGDMSQLNSLEGRNFRTGLMGGAYGAGRIYLDGFEIPIMPYDFGLIDSVNQFDMYMLTGQVGSMKLLNGEYNDLNAATGKAPNYVAIDNGMLLTYPQDDHTCVQEIVEMQPRMLCWAPWAQARIQDVVADVPGGIISADPWNEYFPYD